MSNKKINIFEEMRDEAPATQKQGIIRVATVLPRRMELADQSDKRLGSSESSSRQGSARIGGILSSKILMSSSSPMKNLRLANKMRKE